MISQGQSLAYRQETISSLAQAETLDAFTEEMVRVVLLLQQTEKESLVKEDACSRAKACIEQNYQDPDLNVSKLGQEVGVSPSYLSKMYKEKYGMSLLDSLSFTRIQKAKEYLTNSSSSIYEIAEKTGFLSSNVFIKAFKKWEGITPGAFRELSTKKPSS